MFDGFVFLYPQVAIGFRGNDIGTSPPVPEKRGSLLCTLKILCFPRALRGSSGSRHLLPRHAWLRRVFSCVLCAATSSASRLITFMISEQVLYKRHEPEII